MTFYVLWISYAFSVTFCVRVTVRGLACALVFAFGLVLQNISIIKIFYTLLARQVVSYFIVQRWNPVKLIGEDICGRWLGLCRYAEYRHRCSSPCHMPRLLLLQTGQSLKCGRARQGWHSPAGQGRISGLSGLVSLGRVLGQNPDAVIYFKFHRNPFKGFEIMGVEIWLFPLLWLLAFTTACTTV